MADGFGFQWHITWRCENRCMHCYQSDAESAAGPSADLPIGELKSIADVIMRGVPGPVAVNVTGGEPFLYRDRGVFELMAHLSKFDSLGELNVITSAGGMDRGAVRDLKALPKLSHVKVSLESHDPQINDGIRWPGHYEAAVEGIRELVGSGLRAIVMATLSKRNFRSVAGLCAFAEGLGARGVIFERFVPLGRGAAEMRDSALTRKEWLEILRAISGIARVGVDELRPYKALWVDGPAVSGAPCCLGAGSMALMPDGSVYPCRRVPEPVGRLPGDGMERILAALGGYSSSPQKCFGFGF